MCLYQSYKRYKITKIKWISGDTNLVDTMIKSKPYHALKELINTNKLYIKMSTQVERSVVLLTIHTPKYKNIAFMALISTTINQINTPFLYIIISLLWSPRLLFITVFIASIYYPVSPNIYELYPVIPIFLSFFQRVASVRTSISILDI